MHTHLREIDSSGAIRKYTGKCTIASTSPLMEDEHLEN
jgi:hypothetical protein